MVPSRDQGFWLFVSLKSSKRASVGKAIFCSVHCGAKVPGWMPPDVTPPKVLGRRSHGAGAERTDSQTDGLVSSPCRKDQV